MALSGARLQTAIRASTFTQIQAQFPINPDLLPAEKVLILQYQQKIANAVADGDATNTVTEITGNAVVPVGIGGTVTSGPGTGGSTLTNTQGTVL